MVDYFDKLYTSIIDRNKFLVKIRFYSIQRVTIRLIVNLIVPIYYSITKNSLQAKLDGCIKSERKLIVSLTTFPARINRVWIVIESILRQSHKPDMIILWLSKEQFISIEKLPRRLVDLQKRGLVITFCDGDIKSHKKYYYTLKDYPEDFLITIDDDIIYHTTMIEELVRLNKKFPASICCHRGNQIKTKNNKILPYAEWGGGQVGCNKNLFFTSGGGTFFPPHSLHFEVLNDKVFNKLCLNADDVWLNIMCQLNNTTIVKSNYDSVLLLMVYFNNKHLYTTNVTLGENNKQLESVRKYCIEKFGIDVFNKMF